MGLHQLRLSFLAASEYPRPSRPDQSGPATIAGVV
jgi:hypothetical protein